MGVELSAVFASCRNFGHDAFAVNPAGQAQRLTCDKSRTLLALPDPSFLGWCTIKERHLQHRAQSAHLHGTLCSCERSNSPSIFHYYIFIRFVAWFEQTHTGSGKTHNMVGSRTQEEQGLIPRAIDKVREI